MPALSIRLEREGSDGPFSFLRSLLCDEARDAVRRLGLPEPESFLGTTREQWDEWDLDETPAGPWTTSHCPWFAPAVGLDWCRRLRVDLAPRSETFASELEELDVAEAVLRRAEAAGLRWNLMLYE